VPERSITERADFDLTSQLSVNMKTELLDQIVESLAQIVEFFPSSSLSGYTGIEPSALSVDHESDSGKSSQS